MNKAELGNTDFPGMGLMRKKIFPNQEKEFCVDPRP